MAIRDQGKMAVKVGVKVEVKVKVNASRCSSIMTVSISIFSLHEPVHDKGYNSTPCQRQPQKKPGEVLSFFRVSPVNYSDSDSEQTRPRGSNNYFRS